jgi:hypothetical protein
MKAFPFLASFRSNAENQVIGVGASAPGARVIDHFPVGIRLVYAGISGTKAATAASQNFRFSVFQDRALRCAIRGPLDAPDAHAAVTPSLRRPEWPQFSLRGPRRALRRGSAIGPPQLPQGVSLCVPGGTTCTAVPPPDRPRYAPLGRRKCLTSPPALQTELTFLR